jgi:hypothetical protein
MYVLALEGRPKDLQGYLLKADGCQMCCADWPIIVSGEDPLTVTADACRAVSVPLSICGRASSWTSFLRVSMLGLRLQRHAAYRTSVCGFCQKRPIAGPQKPAAYIAPHNIRAIRVARKSVAMLDVFLA